ncbi:MAG: DUF599 family protein [Candidatus Bilamarchaeaceae archaeon]
MELLGYTITIDELAAIIFLFCFFASLYLREYARKLEGSITGKRIRSIYRKSCIETLLKEDKNETLIEILRNGVLISTALMSAIIISFGFVLAKAPTLESILDFLTMFKIIAIFALLVYAFLMLLLESRTLVYIPIVFNTSEKLIEKYEGTNKVIYVSKLLHESFDHFSNAVRAIIFVVILLTWFYNVYLFITLTIVLSSLMVMEDFGKKSTITMF